MGNCLSSMSGRIVTVKAVRPRSTENVVLHVIALLFISAASLVAGDGSVRHSTRPAPGIYIVVLNENSDVTSALNDILRVHGGTLRYVWRGSPLQGFSLEGLNEAAASAISADRRVRYVEEAGIGELLNASPYQWGLDRLNQRTLPPDGLIQRDCNVGGGVRVYVMDCGINHITAEFGSRVIDGWHRPLDLDGFADTLDHGTDVAAIIGGNTFGVAPGVTLVNVKVSGGGYQDVVDDGINAIHNYINVDADAYTTGPKIVNMSVLYPQSDTLDTEILNSVANHNLTYVVGAGNGTQNPDGTWNTGIDACTAGSPAHLGPNPGVITVGSTMLSDDMLQDLRSVHPSGEPPKYPNAWGSNYGSCIDIFAPGSTVDTIDFNGAATKFSGTSASTPYVTGAAARHMTVYWQSVFPPAQEPPANVESDIVSNATTNVIDPSTIGTGSPNRLLWEFANRCRP